MTLKRKTDGERLALVEKLASDNHGDIESIKKDLKTILRNQWVTAGALAAIMIMMNYPQLISVITPVAQAVAAVK